MLRGWKFKEKKTVKKLKESLSIVLSLLLKVLKMSVQMNKKLKMTTPVIIQNTKIQLKNKRISLKET